MIEGTTLTLIPQLELSQTYTIAIPKGSILGKNKMPFDGFSDYTALASTYVEGGALPYALVIHLTYLRSEDQIRVHRFISDTNYNQTNIAGKFTEASRKIEPFFRDMVKTNAVEELISRAADGNGYPGLGYIKKLSIKNHLELIKRIGK